jgi:hypothetical protein
MNNQKLKIQFNFPELMQSCIYNQSNRENKNSVQAILKIINTVDKK